MRYACAAEAGMMLPKFHKPLWRLHGFILGMCATRTHRFDLLCRCMPRHAKKIIERRLLLPCCHANLRGAVQ